MRRTLHEGSLGQSKLEEFGKKLEMLEQGQARSQVVLSEIYKSLSHQIQKQGILPQDRSVHQSVSGARFAAGDKSKEVHRIQNTVAAYYGLKIKDLRGSSRRRTIILARQIGMFLVRKHAELSLQEIGREFGRKDHTTVLHALRKIDRSIQEDLRVRDDVLAVEEALRCTLSTTGRINEN